MATLHLIGAYVLGAVFVAAGLNHFRAPRFYLRIMPEWLPAHDTLVAVTGVTEVISGALMFFAATRGLGAWLIALQLIVFFAVHIDMLLQPQGTGRGVSPAFLWIRLVIQFGLIYWAFSYTGN